MFCCCPMHAASPSISWAIRPSTISFAKAGLYLGSEWSENRAGTCAVGACIVSGEPVIIHQDDHFDASHIGLTCTAAPVFDTLGDLTAVLDISQLRSPTAKTSQQLALHLVSATARRIELANLMTRTRNDWVLRLARSPEFLDVDPDAAIALDGSGRITGMTHGGFGALARSMNIRGLRTRDFLGLPVSEVFDIDVDDLPNFMRGRPNGERLLRAKSGLVLFASAIAPVVSHRAPAVPEQHLPRALRDLSHGDTAMERVQTRAAKLATRRIPILIQGETGSGKEYSLARSMTVAATTAISSPSIARPSRSTSSDPNYSATLRRLYRRQPEGQARPDRGCRRRNPVPRRDRRHAALAAKPIVARARKTRSNRSAR